MKLLGIYPGWRLLLLVAAMVIAAFTIPAFWPSLMTVLIAGCLITLILAAAETVMLLRLSPISIKRSAPATIAVDHEVEFILHLNHSNSHTLQLQLVDCLPESFSKEAVPVSLDLPTSRTVTVTDSITPIQRGCFRLDSCEVRIYGFLKLMTARFRVNCQSEVKVFPDFDAIRTYTILATDNHTSQIGIYKRIARGEGSEFHQLRQYLPGDPLRQINWKATARRSQLISNEYQRERDQQIILLVDNGRRMRSRDDALSHFDHALNAAILVSYIALRQGDSVGVLSFGHTLRWVPVGRGEKQSSIILNSLYDLQPGNSASDYIGAGERLTHYQKKRSLVLLLTNTRDEDLDDLVAACKNLSSRHLVLLANIQEGFIGDELKKPVQDFSQALLYSAVSEYQQSRQETLRSLRARGVHCIDCSADQLAASVSNAYLEIKNSGQL